ncbi:hypothetical protein Glove_22g94 [Diversispora epigaea]|uniref:Uncharacterized protein n=1 Tax=Diversispora epigaea TaxID=1348612 RepID=A0A397JJB4_9GLOM|nr:hypothetical protein Glove_22g94 [Diversispora epigaea]
MNISEAITNYFYERRVRILQDITSNDCEKIKTELKFHLRSISTHNSMSKKVHNKAYRLLDELDQFFQSKREIQNEDDELDEELTSPSPLQDSYMKDHEYFDSLVNNVDLSYIGREKGMPNTYNLSS